MRAVEVVARRQDWPLDSTGCGEQHSTLDKRYRTICSDTKMQTAADDSQVAHRCTTAKSCGCVETALVSARNTKSYKWKLNGNELQCLKRGEHISSWRLLDQGTHPVNTLNHDTPMLLQLAHIVSSACPRCVYVCTNLP